MIDNVKIWNKALSETEVKELCKKELIKERKQEVLKYSKLQTDLLIQEDRIKMIDNKIQELQENGKA